MRCIEWNGCRNLTMVGRIEFENLRGKAGTIGEFL